MATVAELDSHHQENRTQGEPQESLQNLGFTSTLLKTDAPVVM